MLLLLASQSRKQLQSLRLISALGHIDYPYLSRSICINRVFDLYMMFLHIITILLNILCLLQTANIKHHAYRGITLYPPNSYSGVYR